MAITKVRITHHARTLIDCKSPSIQREVDVEYLNEDTATTHRVTLERLLEIHAKFVAISNSKHHGL